MPVEQFWERDGLFVRMHGALTSQEIQESTRSISSSPEFERIRYVLVDLADARPVEASDADEVSESITDRLSSRQPRSGIVEAHVLGAPRRFTRADGAGTRERPRAPRHVFSTVQEARAWIATSIGR